MAKKSVAVIGLGQFGQAVVEELVNNSADVIAIDNDPESVQKVAQYLPTVFIADSTNEQALKELGIADVSVAVVAFGENQQASILTTVLLKELGVKRIIVRVEDEYYEKIFLRLGATETIAPQKMAGESLANRIYNTSYSNFYKLDEKYSIVAIQINPDFVGKTLIEINSNFKYGVSIVLIVRNGTSFIPSGRDQILGGDTVYCVGTTKDISKFGDALNAELKKKAKKK